MILTPEGEPAGDLDRISLLAMWSRFLESQGRCMISSCMGKPTFALNPHAVRIAAKHWSQLHAKVEDILQAFRKNPDSSEIRDWIVQRKDAIDYGDPQGDSEARHLIAHALTRWYKHIEVKAGHVLFTVGGAAAIHLVLNGLSNPKAKVITPFPYYSLYATSNPSLRLHPIEVMNEPGYRLTAKALAKSLACNTHPIAAFLFCDPNNPLGTMVSQAEWQEMATLLNQYPEVPIILDEAYAEMRLDGQMHQSLLEIAPELYPRTILLRSATKGLSAAGQRMAVLVTPDASLMSRLVAKNVSMYGHAPRIEQLIFASALDHFSETEAYDLAAFYAPQVRLTQRRLKAMNAAMKDPLYQVEGTFYVLADLSELLGLPLPKEAARVGKSGLIQTDEDMAYYLLFKGVSIAPLSYFGASPKKGFMRMTCSAGDTQINALCDILQRALEEARELKREKGVSVCPVVE